MKAPEPKLAAWAKRVKAEVEARAKQKPTTLLESLAKAGPKPPPLERALRASSPSIVAELRRKALDGTWVDRELDLAEASAEAKQGGAAALLVATDPHVHGAIDGDISRVRGPGLPVIRYETVIHRHQLAEARVSGAAGVTVHAALHDTKSLAALLKVGAELGLAVLPIVATVDETNAVLETGAAFACVSLHDDDSGNVVEGRAEALVPLLAKAGTLVLVRAECSTASGMASLASLGAQSIVTCAPFVKAGDRAAFLRGLVAPA